MARRYLLSGDWPIARIERDINNGRNGEKVLARQKRHDITSELNHTARVWFDALPENCIFHIFLCMSFYTAWVMKGSR